MTGPEVTAYIGLGSNLGDRQQQIHRALQALQTHPRISLTAVSGIFETAPWGVEDQPLFLNAVAAIRTAMGPDALLGVLKQMESELGRSSSSTRWGPRAMDLDLLVHGDAQLKTPELTVPHRCLHKRAFVLVPLLELDPELEIPGGEPAAQALRQLDRAEKAGVVRYADAPEIQISQFEQNR